MKRKKIIVIIAVIMIVGALGGAGFYFRDEIMGAIPFLQTAQSSDKVYVEKVSKIMGQSTGVSNRYNGVVESQDTYEVNVDSSRTIKDILVKVGDTIKEGQPLVTYDSSEIEMQVKQAQLELESINNDIDNYKKQIDKLNEQISKSTDDDDKFSYQADIQTAENSIEQSKFDLESKNLEISKFQKQIKESTIVSKKAGVVKEINQNGTDANGNSAAFMTILQEGQYRVKGSIDEQNVWMISSGQKVLIRSRVDEKKTWEGTVGKVDTENIQKKDSDSSDDTQTATKYPFYVELSSVDGLLLGQHVYIEMDEGQDKAKEGVWLFADYVVQDDTGSYVWAASDKNRLEKRPVELGEFDSDLNQYEIVSGLTDKDYITWPMPGLYEGVTTVTDASEVDYSSPLYNQDSTEGPEEMQGMDRVEGIDSGTEMPGEGLFDNQEGTESEMMQEDEPIRSGDAMDVEVEQ